jgi:cytochrome oxidase Cu insertion factor (SCO1/SenC/PrrC family)
MRRLHAYLLGLVLAAACTSEQPAPNDAARAPGTARSAPPARTEQLHPGESVPAAVTAGARHWQRTGAAGSRILIVNFASTRCSAESGCAENERKLRAVQDELHKAPSLKSSIGLLTMSVDPIHDVPAVLRAHADRVGADPELWRFAALPANQVDAVLGQFGAARESGTTAIVDADGKLVNIYPAGWSVAELAGDVQSLVLRAEPSVIAAYIEAQEALAADDERAARGALARLEAAVAEPAVDRLASAAGRAKDLSAMRTAFKPLSEAFVRLPWPKEYQPMYCPMFEDNAGATWVQKTGPVINPYYGKAMLRCGTDMSTGAHQDHSPRYGGVLFMAADAFHHVEGTYTGDGMFRAHVYDNFKQPMQVAGLKAWLEVGSRGIPLSPSADRLTLDARVGTLPFPAEMTLKMTFGKGTEEERFDFVFTAFSPGR